MEAVEFKTCAENGIIRIPEEYRKMAEGDVKIIILKQDNIPGLLGTGRHANIKRLLKKIQKKGIFQSIDNPVAWQRTIRDEWA